MTYEQLVQLFHDDDKYITYIAKRFLIPLTLDEIAVSEGLPPGTFHHLFTDFPEYEQKFQLKVEMEDNNVKDLFLRQVSLGALQKLVTIINQPGDADNKDIIQACKAILTYRPSSRKPTDSTGLESIFSDLVEGEDGK